MKVNPAAGAQGRPLVRVVGVEIDVERPVREARGEFGDERVAQGGAVADSEVDEDVEGDGGTFVVKEDAVDGLDAGAALRGGLDGVAVGATGGIDGVDADREEDVEGVENGALHGVGEPMDRGGVERAVDFDMHRSDGGVDPAPAARTSAAMAMALKYSMRP